MKKIILFLFTLLLILGIGLYAASGFLLARATDRALDYVTGNVRLPDLAYTRPHFGSVRWSSWNAVTWTDLSLQASLPRNHALQTSGEIALNAAEMTISLESFRWRTVLIRIGGLSAVAKEKGPAVDPDGFASRMEEGQLEIVLGLTGFRASDLLAQLRMLKDEVQRFSTLGVTRIPISFSATHRFEIQRKPCVARFQVIKEDQEYRLVMDRRDLAAIAALLPGQKPNPVDLALIARNPLKAPTLLKISDKAGSTAQQAAQQNPRIPEDAYRHTLWSYLLTRVYGESFAKEVTDAHEAYADEEEIDKADRIDFRAASYQDLVNNAVGRQYALQGHPEATLLDRVLTDPAIIRDPEAQKRFDPVDYERLKPAPPIRP